MLTKERGGRGKFIEKNQLRLSPSLVCALHHSGSGACGSFYLVGCSLRRVHHLAAEQALALRPTPWASARRRIGPAATFRFFRLEVATTRNVNSPQTHFADGAAANGSCNTEKKNSKLSVAHHVSSLFLHFAEIWDAGNVVSSAGASVA